MSRLRIVIGVSLVAGISGCAPLPITYYMPSADHATIRQANCDQAPPYEAVLDSGGLRTSALFDGRRIVLGFYPTDAPSTITLETSKIQIEVDGQVVNLRKLQFHTSQSRSELVSQFALTDVPNVDASLSMTGWSSHLFAEIPMAGPASLVLHLPPITLNGVLIPAQTISFQRVRKVNMRFLVLNC